MTEQSGLDPDMYSIAVTAADYDNDGYEDLLVTGYGKVVLYHNDGNGHFTDVTEKAGIKVNGWAISSTWLDYDKDGCARSVCWAATSSSIPSTALFTRRITIRGRSTMRARPTCCSTTTATEHLPT